MKSVYNFKRDPIVIPDDVKNRDHRKFSDDCSPASKKVKVSEDSEVDKFQSKENVEEKIDLDTMLGTFVDTLIDT